MASALHRLWHTDVKRFFVIVDAYLRVEHIVDPRV